MELINLPIVRGLEKDTHLYNILLEIDKRDGVVCGGFARYCAADKIIENEDFAKEQLLLFNLLWKKH